MSARRGVLAFVVVLVAGLAALAVSASGGHQVRAFALGVPNVGPVAGLSPGQRACEGPIVAPAAFGAVRVWASYVGRPGTLEATVQDSAGGRQLAGGRAPVPVIGGQLTADLSRPIAAGRQVTVCLRNLVPATVTLLGSGPLDKRIHLTVGGRAVPLSLAMTALTPHPHSLLAEVPTIFKRAGLFRFSWIGSWTFWVLLAGLAVAAVLCAVAVAAAGEDP